MDERALFAGGISRISKGGRIRPECQKSVEKVPNDPEKKVKKITKSVFGDFFDTFLTLWAGRPGKSFLRAFGDFGARGCRDSSS